MLDTTSLSIIRKQAAELIDRMYYIEEYVRNLQEVCILEGITMAELFIQFDAVLDDPRDIKFFRAVKAYYYGQSFI